jgi:hypothetical protein
MQSSSVEVVSKRKKSEVKMLMRRSPLHKVTFKTEIIRKSTMTQTYGLAFLVGATQSSLGDYYSEYYKSY